MHCRIRITWHLDPSWQAWLEDLQIVHEAEGTTLLIGQLPDQAALYGVLLTIRRLGLRLRWQSSCAEVVFPHTLREEIRKHDGREHPYPSCLCWQPGPHF